MARWEPGARERLVMAALDAFTEDGFEQTTVAGIAERAGVTERTFFRHFADKREVLFEGSQILEQQVTGAIADAPATLGPLEIIAGAYATLGPFFAERHHFARQRADAIAANTSLLERELLKLHTLTAATAAALRKRGVPEAVATLAAEVGATIFHVGFQNWIDDESGADVDVHILRAFADLTELFTRG